MEGWGGGGAGDFSLFPSLTVGRSFSCSLSYSHSDWFSGGGIGMDEGALSLAHIPPAEVKGARIYVE